MSRDLGLVDVLGVEVVGEPGQRKFYLYVGGALGSALIWLEKEQLNRLSLTLDRVLAQLSEGQILRTEAQVGKQAAPPGMPHDFPRRPEYDLREAQMSLTYDRRDETFLFALAPIELIVEPGQEPQALVHEEETLSFIFSKRQAHTLTSTIATVISSGRPVCPLCHAVLDGGPHACEKQNGHHTIVQVIEEDEEEA